MSDVDIKLNPAGVRAIFKDGGTQGLLYNEAKKIANKANSQVRCDGTTKPHYGVVNQVGEVSARSLVVTNSMHARRSEAKHHYLKNSL